MIWHFDHLPQVIVVFLVLGLLTALSNHLAIRRFDQYPRASIFPRVSVLVPARNEADNIEACVRSLLRQDYPDFEVIVLDDHSEDETRPILSRLARTSNRLRVLDGYSLPEGWLGKHWACHQLAQAATGDLLLFTDADTRHAPSMLRDSVSALLAERADLVTAFPREEAVTWGEKLIIPVIGFGIFSFLPVTLSRWLRWAGLSVTIGQFMLFRRSAFEAIGGYEAVRDHIVDDVMLGRRIHGMRSASTEVPGNGHAIGHRLGIGIGELKRCKSLHPVAHLLELLGGKFLLYVFSPATADHGPAIGIEDHFITETSNPTLAGKGKYHLGRSRKGCILHDNRAGRGSEHRLAAHQKQNNGKKHLAHGILIQNQSRNGLRPGERMPAGLSDSR